MKIDTDNSWKNLTKEQTNEGVGTSELPPGFAPASDSSIDQVGGWGLPFWVPKPNGIKRENHKGFPKEKYNCRQVRVPGFAIAGRPGGFTREKCDTRQATV